MTLYIDVLFIENLIMNYILIYMTSFFGKIKVKHMRLFISSVIGAIYAVLSCISNLQVYQLTISKFILSAVMVIVAFAPRKILDFFKYMLIFYLITFVLGGSIFGLMYFLNYTSVSINGVVYMDDFPIKIFMIATVSIFFAIKLGFYLFANKFRLKERLFKIKIEVLNDYVETTALLDTGNLAVDPLTKMPVVIIEKSELKYFLSEDIVEVFDEENLDDFYNNVFELSAEWRTRLRIIPFSSLGSESSMMIGFKPDRLYIYDKNLETEKVIIAVCDKKLSRDDTYNALIGADIVG